MVPCGTRYLVVVALGNTNKGQICQTKATTYLNKLLILFDFFYLVFKIFFCEDT